MHTSDEQLEDLLAQGERGPQQADPATVEHVRTCPHCRQRLEQAKILRQRLRAALAGLHAPPEARQNVLAALERPEATHARPFYVRLMPLAAAAVILLTVGLPLLLNLGAPSSAQAAQEELVQIHQMNLSEGHGFYSSDDPSKLAQYFRTELGFAPAMPKSGQGLAIRGCCVAHFKGQIAGSYVVKTPSGLISIIVVNDPPQSLAPSGHVQQGDQTYWTGTFSQRNMACVRLGHYTYCAVADANVPHDRLIDLLGRLVR